MFDQYQGASNQEQPDEGERAIARARRRPGLIALLAAGVLLAVFAVGVAGAAVGLRWLAPEPTPATAPVVMARPVANQTAAPENVAGAVYDAVGNAVVEIVTSVEGRRGSMPVGGGSGVVVDQRGLILTAAHVVEGVENVRVRFANGDVRDAKVLGTDSGNDLALLQVELPEGIPVAPLGDSDQVRVGDVVIAIGSPFGLQGTVTQGIISAVNRTWQPGHGRTRTGLLQTDAPINPGNSGGPLFNVNGEVIGIATMIESPIRGSVGIGFAVPSNTARRLLPQLEAGAQLQPAWLGISGVTVDQALAQEQRLSVDKGVLVVSVVPNSPADQAGLRGGEDTGDGSVPRGGDIIVAIDGTPIETMDQLVEQISRHAPGDTVRLTIVRDGQQQEVTVTLGRWPAEAP
jgi:serine protease Do